MLHSIIRKFFPGKTPPLDPNNVPKHIAIIMDGNGRWATGRGLPRIAGHRMGVEALKRTITACGEIGVKYLTVYAFSTENWERPANEVDFLISLFSETIDKELLSLAKNKIRIRFLGRLKSFPPELQNKMLRAMEQTSPNTDFNLNIMVSYGGRAEIVDAVMRVVDGVANGEIRKESINEKTISERLYTADIPDPDLMIRTAWERRISNFLLWQAAYTELYFTAKLWPDFGMNELAAAVRDYQGRRRKFGKI